MTTRMITSALVAALMTAAPLPGQMLGTYSTVDDAYQDRCDVDAAFPGGVCPAGHFSVPARPPTPWPAGAVTANHRFRRLFMTDGVTDIIRFRHAHTGLLGSGGPVSPLPIPPPYVPAVAPSSAAPTSLLREAGDRDRMGVTPISEFRFLVRGGGPPGLESPPKPPGRPRRQGRLGHDLKGAEPCYVSRY